MKILIISNQYFHVTTLLYQQVDVMLVRMYFLDMHSMSVSVPSQIKASVLQSEQKTSPLGNHEGTRFM